MRAEGAYELITKIGAGSTSDVYLARPLLTPPPSASSEPLYAVKLIHPHLIERPGYREALARERATAVAFAHPSSCKILEVDDARDGSTSIVMEHLHGQTLDAVLERAGRLGETLSSPLMAWIALRAAQALYTAHKTPWAAGEPSPILHGAMSPRSMMITYDGELKVLGMGLGRSELCLPPSIATLSYRAPELIERTGTDRRADIYSLGMILYDAISGQKVFQRATGEETEAAVLRHVLPPFNEVAREGSAGLLGIVEAMIRRKRAERPQSMSQVIAVLEHEVGPDAEMSAELAARLLIWFAEELRGTREMLDIASRMRVAHAEDQSERDPSDEDRRIASLPTMPSVPFPADKMAALIAMQHDVVTVPEARMPEPREARRPITESHSGEAVPPDAASRSRLVAMRDVSGVSTIPEMPIPSLVAPVAAPVEAEPVEIAISFEEAVEPEVVEAEALAAELPTPASTPALELDDGFEHFDHGPSVPAAAASAYTSEGIELSDDDAGDGDMMIAPAFEFLGEASYAMSDSLSSGLELDLPPPKPAARSAVEPSAEPAFDIDSEPEPDSPIAEDLIDDVLRMGTGEYDIAAYVEEAPPLQQAIASERAASPHIPQPAPMPPPPQLALPRADSGSLRAFPPPGASPLPADIGQIALDLYQQLTEDTSKRK